MKLTQVRRYAMSLPEVTEEPHFNCASFRVRGKIFATVPPDDEHLHVFIAEREREPALAMFPEFIEKLYWGAKVVGLSISLTHAKPKLVNTLLLQAWQKKAPKSALKSAPM